MKLKWIYLSKQEGYECVRKCVRKPRFHTFRWEISGPVEYSIVYPQMKISSQVDIWKIEENHENWVREQNKARYRPHFFFSGRALWWYFLKKIWYPQIKNRRNFDGRIVKIQKSKIEKIAKIDNILNLDLEVVAHSKTVQNTSKTPTLTIFGLL